MFNLDITIIYLFSAIALGMWVIGLFIGRDMISQVLGIIISFIASIIWISLWVFTDNIIPSYSVPQIANTTQSGGIESCTVSGSTTTCTPTAITKSFSYVNSTGQITNKPDSIPNLFPLQGNVNTGANSQDIYIRIFAIAFGILMAFVGIFQQRWRST